MNLRFGTPNGLREEYRSVLQNVLIALGLGLYTAYFVTRSWHSTNDQSIPLSWWSLPVLGVGVLAVVIRALRRGVFVTNWVLIERRLFVTRLVPWSALDDVSFSLAGDSLRAKVDGRAMSMVVPRKRMHTPFSASVQSAMANAQATRTDRVRTPYPARGQRWITCALLASCAVLATGVAVVEVALRDRDIYRLRAARDVHGIAEVAGSHIDEHDSDEGGTTYTTWVDIRFHLGDRTVRTQLHRPGRWEYQAESQIDIVYDAAHPRDADFGNRLNRRANDSSVSLRLVVGPILSALGALGCVGFGTVVIVNTVKSRGVAGREPPVVIDRS